MSDVATISEDQLSELRNQILADPDIVLEDQEVMRALVGETRPGDGRKIVDLRGRLVAKLEDQLDKLESTHRTVIAAAYENLAGTNQIHRAALALMAQDSLEGVLICLRNAVAPMVSVDLVRLVLETRPASADALGQEAAETLLILPPRSIDAYMTLGRSSSARQVTLRPAPETVDVIFGEDNGWIGSEALLTLAVKDDAADAMIAFGVEDANRFNAEQGTDLLAFLASVAELTLRRIL